MGTPKAVPAALAVYAEKLHSEGKEFKVGLITGGATGSQVDSALAQAHAVAFRTPFQSNKEMGSGGTSPCRRKGLSMPPPPTV